MHDPAPPSQDPLPAVMLAVAEHGDHLGQHSARLDDHDGRLTGMAGRLLAVEQLLEGARHAAQNVAWFRLPSR